MLTKTPDWYTWIGYKSLHVVIAALERCQQFSDFNELADYNCVVLRWRVPPRSLTKLLLKFRGYLTPERLSLSSDVEEWLQDNSILFSTAYWDYKIFLFFKNPEDMMHFKLVWLSE